MMDGRRKTDKAFSFIFFLLLVFLLNWSIGCSEKEESGSKSLFSTWTAVSDGLVLDLTTVDFGNYPLRYYVNASAGCDCALTLTGDETSGVAYIGSCTHFGPTDYCGAGTDQYDYTNQNAVLTLCGMGGCEEYR